MKKTIMWDVDTQRDFMEPTGKLYVPGTEDIRYAIDTAMARADHYGYPLLGSVDAHAPNDEEFRQFPEHCVYGTPGQLKMPYTLRENPLFVPSHELNRNQLREIAEHKYQVLFEKQTPDCSMNENLKPFLELKNPEVVCIYGIVTDICVDRAVLFMLGMDYDVYVIEDAIMGLDKASAEECKNNWKCLGAKFVKAGKVGVF